MFERQWFRRYLVHCDGSVWTNPNGNRNVGYLWEDDDNRKLNLNWFDNRWNANYRFLAFRKSLLGIGGFRRQLHLLPPSTEHFTDLIKRLT
jgi:hypothetical protein